MDGAWIYKFPADAAAEAALRREASALRAVRPHLTVPVPDLVLVEAPRLYSRHRMLPGVPLLADVYDGLDDPTRARLADDCGRFFAELHAVPPAALSQAGARPVDVWDTSDATLDPVWPTLDTATAAAARSAIDRYRWLDVASLGVVFGHFDAHGWNMALDRAAGRLGGIFDFADSGLGPPEREFVPLSLISPDLAARTLSAYRRRIGRPVNRSAVFALAAAMRLSEYAGALATGDDVGFTRKSVLDWFRQTDIV